MNFSNDLPKSTPGLKFSFIFLVFLPFLKSEKSKLSRGISSIVKMRNEKQISEREASKQIEAERENYLKTIKELRAKLKKNEPGSGPRYVD